MKIIRYILLGGMLFWQTIILAQQLPLFSQYREYGSVINPAWVGSDYLYYGNPTTFGVSYRRQWIAAGDGPQTQLLRGDHLFDQNGVKLIAGGYLLNDEVARVSTTGLYGRLGGLKVWNENNPLLGGISAGISLGGVRYGLDLTDARIKDPSEIAGAALLKKYFYDVGVGVFVYQALDRNGEHILSGGISVPQVFGLNVQFREEDGSVGIKRIQHVYGNLNYRRELGEDGAFFEFSTWGKFVAPLKPHVDFNIRWSPGSEGSSSFWIGAGAGTSRIINGEAGLILMDIGKINQVRVGYAFSHPFSSVSTYFGSSHEINVAFALGGNQDY